MKISGKKLLFGAIATLVSFAAEELTNKGLWALNDKFTKEDCATENEEANENDNNDD